MKVYELINILGEMPAAYDVEISVYAEREDIENIDCENELRIFAKPTEIDELAVDRQVIISTTIKTIIEE